MSILRSFDPNFARRVLRDRMLEIAELTGDQEPVPHTFDTAALLKSATRMIDRRAVQRHVRLHHDLLAAAGVAHVLCGREKAGLELFNRGLKASKSNQRRARFRYHIGHHYYQRRGEMAAARAELQEAYLLSERSRRLRTETLLALGTVESNLELYEAALESFEAARNLHVRDLEPHALMRQAIVLMRQGDLDGSEKLNRRSHALFRRFREWLGMNVADRNLAVLYLERGNAKEARQLLERTVSEEHRVLDLARLGRSYNNLGVACSRLGDHEAARDAFTRAICFSTATGRQRLLAGHYHNLGRCLAALGDLKGSFAAFDTALQLSREIQATEFEFETLTDIIEVCTRSKARFDVMPGVLARCYNLLQTHYESMSKRRLAEFARVTQGIIGNRKIQPFRQGRPRTRPPKLATRDGLTALKRMVPDSSQCDFESMLTSKLGEGMSGRNVPDVESLRRFLMLFTGDYFKSANYTREFDITQERAKRHLRWLCGEGVIERYGSRKASRYALAFHR